MPTISSPANFSGRTHIGRLALDFKEGKADVADADLSDGVRRYLTERGYGIDGDPVAPAAAPEPPDPRKVTPTQINKLRDAAVDPKPEDYLAPINAGKENPHGPKVAAPGIHAAPGKPIHPGPVGKAGGKNEPSVVKDTDAQAANESALASDSLIDNVPAGEAVEKAAARADRVNDDQPAKKKPAKKAAS